MKTFSNYYLFTKGEVLCLANALGALACCCTCLGEYRFVREEEFTCPTKLFVRQVPLFRITVEVLSPTCKQYLHIQKQTNSVALSPRANYTD
jgi:hypothetical protein